MLTLTVSLDSLSTYIVAVDILILLSYVLYLFHKKRELEKAKRQITEFIADYFGHTGVPVKVNCFRIEENRKFVVLIESQPLKRFRFSNVLEVNLISHIQETTGYMVEKIYWRFTIQFSNNELSASDDNGLDEEDLYFINGLAHINNSTEYKVSEASWDDYESSRN